MSEQNHNIYEFGPFRLDARKRLLLREGEIVPLKPKAFETLLALVEGGGRVLAKDELMKRVWPDTTVEEGNLTFNISSLRKGLGDDPRRHEYIVTIPGEGYQFVAGVRATFDELVVHESTTMTIEELDGEMVGMGDGETRGKEEILLLPAFHSTNSSVAPVSLSEKTSIRNFAGARRWLGLVVLFFVGTAAAFSLYWIMRQRQSRAATVPFSEMEISRLTTSGKITHAAVSPDGEYIAHVTVDAEGDSLWVRHVGAPTSVRISGPAATEYVSVIFAPDGDSVYYLTLDRDKGDTALYRVPVLGGPSTMAAYDVGPVDFSPDGSQITFIRPDRTVSRLILASSDGTNERTLATRRQPEFFRDDWNAPAWSPDGKTIACQVRLNDERGQYETVIGVSVEDGSQKPLASKRWNYTGQPVWLADGSGLFVTGSESETGPVQVWHAALKSGEVTRITHDLNDYHDLSLPNDSSRLTAVQDHSVSSIWVAPEADAGQMRQIASDAGWISEMAWTPDGRIVYRSNAGGSAEIWVMNADGSSPKQLTTDARATRGLTVSPDGRYIFFASDRAGRFNIWRVDAEGGNLKQLTTGHDEFFPHSTPDGGWVVYQRGVAEPRLWKVPADGGEPTQLTETRAARPAVSSDGELIAYHYLDPDVEKSRWRIGVVSSKGGARLKQFDFPATMTRRFVRWSPDHQSIVYANNPGGLSDLWAQPLDGSQPKQLTYFKVEQIIAFDWSRDGRSLAFVRGVETSDIVLIEQGQK
ncbi:MAG: winged helix-turn-helix domain-containing protein [Pyrinomonadaceae bacterium]|nr:winged helix-turn-helix domain-containing protein [Pyrinomonadaceae bacterium]